MTKKTKFFTLIALYGVLALADGALTYINTPDLSREGNPLVAQLGLGWEALAIANIAIFVLVVALGYYSYFKYQTIYTDQKRFTSYCSQVLYNRPDRFWSGIIVKNWRPYLAAMGFAALYSLIVARVIIVAEWLMVTFDIDMTAYNHFRSTYCFGRLDVVVGVVLALVMVLVWFYREYKKQLCSEDSI